MNCRRYLFPSEFNTGLPIDLGEDGPPDNGTQSPPGPNNWLPYPVFTAASVRQVFVPYARFRHR